MYKLLIVDDEEKILSLIGKYAEFEGYSYVGAANGMEAIAKFKQDTFDLVVMDIMMPVLDGFSACREIRKTSDVPIILLSARGEEYDRINGFQLGVDDYVVKPFSPKELMLRIEAILKRVKKNENAINDTESNSHEIFSYKGLRIDFTARIVYIDDVKVELTPKEYELIFYLVRNRDIALSRDKILSEVWGFDFYGDDRTLDAHIKTLRHKLGDYSENIVTLRGVGYRFESR
ncbi:MAG: response regulator transcription factor [Clostridia bacterium]|nr:response regulator transcription factor [Clostridia bacterium]